MRTLGQAWFLGGESWEEIHWHTSLSGTEEMHLHDMKLITAPESSGTPRAKELLDLPLLARVPARSEDDPDPEQQAMDSEAAAASTEMHCVTGTFADPSQELDFAAQLFRMAFPCHALLMALIAVLIISKLIPTPPDLQGVFAVLVLCVTIGLACRVLLHRMLDSARAQRMGSWTWTVLVAQLAIVDASSYMMAPTVVCALFPEQHFRSLVDLAVAYTNGTHGMGFTHKTALLSFILAYRLFPMAICREVALLPVILCELGVLGIGSAAVHVAELLFRHRYAMKVHEKVQENERRRVRGRLEERIKQLQAEQERLLHDVQRYRGLLAAPRQGCHPAGDTGSSEAGAPAQSHSPPPSLPPGPPSTSTGCGSVAWLLCRDAALATPTHPPSAETPGQYYPEQEPELSELSDMSDLPELVDLAELGELPQLSVLSSALMKPKRRTHEIRPPASSVAAAHTDDSPAAEVGGPLRGKRRLGSSATAIP